MLKQESNNFSSEENKRVRAMQTLPTSARAVMLKFIPPIALLPAIIVSLYASHASVPRLLFSVRQMTRLYAQHVIQRFIPQTQLLEDITELQYFRLLETLTAPRPLTTKPRKQWPIQWYSKRTVMPERRLAKTVTRKNKLLLFSDEHLDLADYNNSGMDFKFTGGYNQHQQDCDVPLTSYGGDRVVPLQIQESNGNLRHKQHNMRYGSSASHYINSGSINHNNGCNTSMETEFVPEPTAPDTTDRKIDQPPDPPVKMIIQLIPMYRSEARVLRYREKIGRQGSLRRQ